MLVKHLKEEDFFHAEAHPSATIKIRNPKPDGNGSYTADGEGTIQGITKPVPITFEVVSESPFLVKGTAIVNRNAFNIGKSKKSKGISEAVEVSFQLSAPGF